ncbi:MAG: iron ABC transporter permease [Clostridia bacterium]|nr:iron ABC transporter permease [Clostridia bacterium]
MIKRKLTTRQRGILVLSVSTALAIMLLLVSICFGPTKLALGRVFATLFGFGTKLENIIVFTYRLPRLVLCLLVGIGMGVSGAIMQSILRNDMASPGTLGISSGSGLFMIIYVILFFGDDYSDLMLPILAFMGGVTSAGIIFLLSKHKGTTISPTKLVLTGVAVSGAYGSAQVFLTLTLEENKIDFVQKWLAGDLWGTQWKYCLILLVWLAIFISYAYYKSNTLNAINLGYDIATGIGVNMNKEFTTISLACVAISSATVAYGGNFFFLGLIAPHITRKLVGSNAKIVLPVSAMIASCIVLLGNLIARNIAFLTGVPVGIIITIISIPYFLYLLSKV